MALELSVIGSDFEVRRVLQSGGPKITLGRDADCDVCLPDPGRNISRRHLVVWNQDNELHFNVVSISNGIEMFFGPVPPGANGVLATGQTLKLAGYDLTVMAVQGDPAQIGDAGWLRDADSSKPAIQAQTTARFLAEKPQEIPASTSSEDDPFGDWGFETTSSPSIVGGWPLAGSQRDGVGHMAAFFSGLGLDPVRVGPLSQGECEEIGILVRNAVLGLIKLHAASSGIKADLHAEDRTIVASKDNNPLKADWPDDIKLQYLFGGRDAGVGFISPDRALRELLGELLAHDLAFDVATRAALEGALGEFAPALLKAKLLVGTSKLFEGARAWEAYSKHYAEQASMLPEWVQRLLDRYFADAYLRESLRIKRETPAGQR